MKTLIHKAPVTIALAVLALALGGALGTMGTTVTFTTVGNATWTCPAGVTSVAAECWGGGGGGGGATNWSRAGGGSGGGYVSNTVAVIAGTNYNLTVGAGGAAGHYTNSSTFANGGPGGSSYFGNSADGNPSGAILLATNGLGGYTCSTPGGTSGSSSKTTNGAPAQTAGNIGGSGGLSYYGAPGTNGTTSYGGGGGAGAGPAGTTGGGLGGTNQSNGNTDGNAGTAPGGAGGGSSHSGAAGGKNGGAGGLGQVQITYTTNNATLSVTVTNPVDGAVFTAPANVLLQASASDSSGTVTNVAFYAGATELADDTTAPYAFTWNNVSAGSYALKAVATDDGGVSSTSSVVNITVNGPFSIVLTNPIGGTVFTAPASILLQATATDTGGTVTNVAFYAGATELADDTTAPYAFTWNNVSAGSYALKAVATDNNGASATSSVVNITVNTTTTNSNAVIAYDPSLAGVVFGVGDVRAALQSNQISSADISLSQVGSQTAPVQIIVTTNGAAVSGMPSVSGLTAQGYAIKRVAVGTNTQWWVIGYDVPGTMYGALDLAEAINLNHGPAGVTNRQVNPYIVNRGIKFNIPLDVRTPTYTENILTPPTMTVMDSQQYNVPAMWDTNFWYRYLDQLARDHYNVMSLWSDSPFASMVNVSAFPNAGLSNVMGMVLTNSSWTAVTYLTNSINDKIAFWQNVMQYGHNRGIDFYLVTWNQFTNGEGGAYTMVIDQNSTVLSNYVRGAVRALFETYPYLTGIGEAPSEEMYKNLTQQQCEDWVWGCYGLGFNDFWAEMTNSQSPYYNPNRVVRFQHRLKGTDVPTIVSDFKNLAGYNNADSTLAFSDKWSIGHMYSTALPSFMLSTLQALPAGKKCWLEVRNEDYYYMRWGDPDYARTYVTNIPVSGGQIMGIQIGSDDWCDGRESVSKTPTSPRQLMIDKMWYRYQLWGRLAYDPTLPDSQFQGILGLNFSQLNGTSVTNLYSGWASVSKILPLVTRFYWGQFDYDWYPEGCFSNKKNPYFVGVQDFITPTFDPIKSTSDGERPPLMDVADYVNGNSTNGYLTPLDVANMLEQYGIAGQTSISNINAGGNAELQGTLGDINAMAWLGRYYAEKIRGAVYLCGYQANSKATNEMIRAISHLQLAATNWSQYAAQWASQYNPQTLIRLDSTPMDMTAFQSSVNADIPAFGVQPPQVSFATPTNGQVFAAGTNLSVTVNATETGGAISNVILYLNNSPLHTDTTSPYQWDSSTDPALGNLAAGTYTLVAVATDAFGVICSNSISISVSGSLPPPPVVNFTASPTNGIRPLAVTFTDTSTGTITNLLWSFGDSQTTNTAGGAVVTHTYQTEGTYTVTLIASGPGGTGTNIQTSLVTVLIPNPPQIGSISQSGTGALVLQGTGGPTNGLYYYWVRSATNLTSPLTDWSIISTNQFNADGSFSNSLPIPSDAPQQFYRLQLP